MKNILILILIAILFEGCGRYVLVNGKEVVMTNDARLFTKNRTISAKAPNNLNIPFIGYYRFDKELLNFERIIPNMMQEKINITVENFDPSKATTLDRLLYKNLNNTFEEYFETLPLTDWKMTNHIERGVNYYKNYVDFVSGLKCGTNVESQNIAEGIGSKKYWTFCPYYDKQGSKKYIGLDYRFYYTFDRTKFQGSDNPSLIGHRFEEVQLQFKKDMKVIFDSMEIYDMDRERMRKEGLLYNKKYILETESNAKDKSLKCTYKTDSLDCIGRETGTQCTRKRGEKYIWDCKYK